jgi:hypothetical protein
MRGLDPRIQASSRKPRFESHWIAGPSPGNDEQRKVEQTPALSSFRGRLLP